MNKQVALSNSFNGDELAQTVWEDKYKAKDEHTPSEMHKRMADEFARIEYNYIEDEIQKDPTPLSDLGKELFEEYKNQNYDGVQQKIYGKFRNFKHIVPQGSIMSQLGNTDSIGSLSNCFVIGQPADSYGGILQKDQELVQLMKRRGGVGIDISTLRPAETKVTNAAGTSTGAASFMERFSNSTREVAQNGRRGALMLSIDVRHPDVLEFINSKKDRTKVTGANISVMLRDDFMEAVKSDDDYILRFPCDTNIEFDSGFVPELAPYNELCQAATCQFKKIKAKELYDSIVENAWENAEPGQMFVDNHWNYSPDGVYDQYRGVTTNPCGEIFMQPYDACRLMALNLLTCVKNPYADKAEIDLALLERNAYYQQRLADDLVDLELEHILRILAKLRHDPEDQTIKQAEIELWEKIYEVASSGRRTGCGFTGLGDMLAALGLKYDSDEALKVIDTVMKIKMQGELKCTIDLAYLRGSFRDWDRNKEFNANPFFKFIKDEFVNEAVKMHEYGRRNVSWSTVAPTGSVSLLTQTTSGLEPLFAPYFTRRKKVNPGDDVRIDFTDQNGDNWMEYDVLHPQFQNWIDREMGEMYRKSSPDLEACFKLSPWYGSCAPDIDWKSRVEIQGIIQKYTTHSISSTINLPKEVTQEEVAEIYLHAFDKDLKGVTVYRDGCRSGVLVTETETPTFEPKDATKRPKELPCDIYNVVAKGKKWTVIIGTLDNKPYEVFAIEGHPITETPGLLVKVKRGVYNIITDKNTYEDVTSHMSAEEEAITRLTSTCLRHGADTTFIVEQLDKSHGDITSFGKALARTLKKYISDEVLQERASSCPSCETGELVFEEGCKQCKSCGYSAC